MQHVPTITLILGSALAMYVSCKLFYNMNRIIPILGIISIVVIVACLVLLAITANKTILNVLYGALVIFWVLLPLNALKSSKKR